MIGGIGAGRKSKADKSSLAQSESSILLSHSVAVHPFAAVIVSVSAHSPNAVHSTRFRSGVYSIIQ